jgi:hypothetical protein
MTPTIRVDDEVYAVLQSKAQAFVDTPNTVLRRELGLDVQAPSTTANAARDLAKGKILTLIEEGRLDEAEKLMWERRQHGVTLRAWVTRGGRLRLEDGREFDTPSGAARELAGYEINGWRTWRRERDGRSLDEIWADRQRELNESGSKKKGNRADAN